jgi:predicted RNA binding protein YcfA (HicA-like mRNA interferase family)
LVLLKMPLSGKEMLRLYMKAGWEVIHQKGSHVQVAKENLHETIPMHRELKRLKDTGGGK